MAEFVQSEPWGAGAGGGASFPGGWWGGASAGLGSLADIGVLLQNLQAREQQEKLYKIHSDPNRLAGYVNRFYAPMSDAQSQAIHRDLGANWSTMTGGAPGGAMNQFVADAMAKIEMQRYADAMRGALQGLGGAPGLIQPQQPMGNLGGIMKSLMTLRQIQQQGQGGTGIAGGGWPRDEGAYQAQRAGERTPFPMPGTASQESYIPDLQMLGVG